MKVSKVEVFPLFVPLSKPIEAPVSIPHADKVQNIVFGGYRATIVRITTDEGLVGYGECMTRFAPAALKCIAIPRSHWPAHMSGQPLYMFLGGRQRDLIPSYASSLRMREESVVLATAREFMDQGFKSMKIKLGKNPEGYVKDIKLVEAIRKAVGDEIVLTVDANCGYHEDYKLALRVGRELEKLGVYWFEEPISPDNIYGYKYLADHLDMAIAWGESSFTRFDFANMFSERCVDIVQPNPSRVGGLTEIAKIAHMSQAFHIPYAPHTGSCSALCLAVSLHIATALPNLLTFEVMRSDWSKEDHNPLRHDLLKEPYDIVEDGFLHAPRADRPGIGVEVNEDILHEFSVA